MFSIEKAFLKFVRGCPSSYWKKDDMTMSQAAFAAGWAAGVAQKPAGGSDAIGQGVSDNGAVGKRVWVPDLVVINHLGEYVFWGNQRECTAYIAKQASPRDFQDVSNTRPMSVPMTKENCGKFR